MGYAITRHEETCGVNRPLPACAKLMQRVVIFITITRDPEPLRLMEGKR